MQPKCQWTAPSATLHLQTWEWMSLESSGQGGHAVSLYSWSHHHLREYTKSLPAPWLEYNILSQLSTLLVLEGECYLDHLLVSRGLVYFVCCSDMSIHKKSEGIMIMCMCAQPYCPADFVMQLWPACRSCIKLTPKQLFSGWPSHKSLKPDPCTSASLLGLKGAAAVIERGSRASSTTFRMLLSVIRSLASHRRSLMLAMSAVCYWHSN